ncbi:Oleandomycin glycosyltransferase [Planctopirus ephydatiae]|uniref:Oleandomycin glycosyltransferase n=1 Tax=Planctopirus ephydatiae TaxID=2528019 RepID=A0A518GTG2_9PLAN|nr:macrolide family glycosyltransferase [Planctopirus ephydatiae]QDV31876.1 Oleandomycin glycosyltransferase [Planctopirus ephydatiae]
MAKIAVFTIPAWGHISPTLPVVKQLVEQGEAVHYYISEEYAERVRDATGADVRVVPRLVDHPVDKLPKSLIGLAGLVLQQSSAWLPNAIEPLRDENYDLILFDRVCPWGRFVADILGIPAVSLFCTVLGMVGGGKPSVHLRYLLMELLDVRMYFQFLKARGQLKKRFQLKKLGFLDLLTNTAEKNIVFTCREFLRHPNQPDASYIFVGPSVVEPATVSDLSITSGDRPLVYVSLGTVVDDAPGFYRACIQSFKDCNVTVYMSIGKRTAISDLGPIPANFVVRNFMPQIEILKCADLFISHGGLGSVNESLHFGVPLLMWTQNPEHAYNAGCVVRTGAGAILKDSDLKPDSLRRRTLAALSDDRLKKAALTMKQVYQLAGGPPRAAEVIMNEILHHANRSRIAGGK